jgi:hypothetical protein
MILALLCLMNYLSYTLNPIYGYAIRIDGKITWKSEYRPGNYSVAKNEFYRTTCNENIQTIELWVYRMWKHCETGSYQHTEGSDHILMSKTCNRNEL